MSLLKALNAWLTGTNREWAPIKKQKRVTPRHPTKKGPGRTGSNPKRPAHQVKIRVCPGVPRGMETGIGVNGIRGASGAGREPGGATTTLCKRTERRSLSQRWSR